MTKLNIVTICVITFCVKKVITFCVGKVLHFALIILLHFELIFITFCVSITFCGDYYILRRNRHFCSKRSKDKLEQLNKQALRTVLNSNSDYETLLRKIGSVNLESSPVQNMLITTYKTLYGIAPPYLKLLLKERKVAYNLRGTLKLNLPRVTTITYGLHSFRYAATQVWNMLPDDVIRSSESLIAFKRAIQDITA